MPQTPRHGSWAGLCSQEIHPGFWNQCRGDGFYSSDWTGVHPPPLASRSPPTLAKTPARGFLFYCPTEGVSHARNHFVATWRASRRHYRSVSFQRALSARTAEGFGRREGRPKLSNLAPTASGAFCTRGPWLTPAKKKPGMRGAAGLLSAHGVDCRGAEPRQHHCYGKRVTHGVVPKASGRRP